MISLFKKLYWDLAAPGTRYLYVCRALRDIPGGFGIALRRIWYAKKLKRVGKNLVILSGVIILNPEKMECGDNVSIGVNNYIQAGGGLVIGSDTMLGPYVKIWTQTHNYKDYDTPVHSQGYTFEQVEIGRDVWVAANVFVMPGAIIRDKCVVSANSVVGRKAYSEGAIIAGYPARKVGERRAQTK